MLEKCKPFVPKLEKYKEELIELSLFAVEIRYPGIKASYDEANSFLSVAEKINKTIKEYLFK